MGRWADAADGLPPRARGPRVRAQGRGVGQPRRRAPRDRRLRRGALGAYDRALDDPDYAERWRALQGRAGALACLGRYAESAASYREAALDPGNPDPGKALNNLGLQFMELDRPEDAVEAYRAALELEGYDGRAPRLGQPRHRLPAAGPQPQGGRELRGRRGRRVRADGPFEEARAAASPSDPPAPAPAARRARGAGGPDRPMQPADRPPTETPQRRRLADRRLAAPGAGDGRRRRRGAAPTTAPASRRGAGPAGRARRRPGHGHRLLRPRPTTTCAASTGAPQGGARAAPEPARPLVRHRGHRAGVRAARGARGGGAAHRFRLAHPDRRRQRHAHRVQGRDSPSTSTGSRPPRPTSTRRWRGYRRPSRRPTWGP